MGTKISEFSNGTLPLAGTELVPIVQGGSTVKTTASAFSTLAPVQSVATRTGNVVLAISDIGNLQTTLDDKLSISGGTISANSTTDALRITQTGTGNALVVEDSANPDATPFVVTADGNVGVGTASPIEIAGQSSVTVNGVTGGGRVDFLKAGTQYGVINCAQTNLFDVEATGASTALRFNTNGAERIRVTETGNVGIGTSNPRSKLDLSNGIIAGVGNIRGQANSGAYSIWGGLGTDSTTDGGYVAFFGSTHSTAANLVNFGNSAVGETMRIAASGNVGIGTSAPVAKLEIQGPGALKLGRSDTSAEGAEIQFCRASDNAVAWYIDQNGTGTGTDYGALRFFTGSSTMRLSLASNGNIGFNTTVLGTGAVGVIGIANGTAPSAAVAGVGQLYVEAGALKYRGSSGTVTTIANA
jgi:hypothetical protein